MTTSGGVLARGIIAGPLKETHPDRIVMGDAVLFLRAAMTCHYTVGTVLGVIYTELNRRREVDQIAPTEPRK